MSNKRKELALAVVSGLLIVVFVFLGTADRDHSIVHRLCDGCFAAGMLLGGMGVILHCANQGALNLFGYGARFGLNLILPIFGKNPWKADGERESYYDYCARKQEQEPKPTSHLLLAGGFYLLLAAVLLVVYLTV